MNRLRIWCLTPAGALLGGLFLIPLGITLAYSLMTRGPYGGVFSPFTWENYSRLADPLYAAILWRSALYAVTATTICLFMGFPLALFIARSGRRRNLYLSLVIVPFWTSFLVRTYAWMFLLRDTGLINSMLLAAGVIHQPLTLLYTPFAVILGLVYGYLPFMVLPIFATLERLDKSLVEASADLGAAPRATLRHVIIPLARPGIMAGSILVFISSLGAYLTPDLLGGGKTIMIGNLVQNQFTSARDWPFGAALSLILMLVVMGMLLPLRRQSGGML
ncbi:MAG: Spermidine/putrescine transport system permease protein PotB [Bryobacteraceae bacterium]|nr:Spermidine/putrescine transport system permease protein PotB [Bryobacteraceae bacterium]